METAALQSLKQEYQAIIAELLEQNRKLQEQKFVLGPDYIAWALAMNAQHNALKARHDKNMDDLRTILEAVIPNDRAIVSELLKSW